MLGCCPASSLHAHALLTPGLAHLTCCRACRPCPLWAASRSLPSTWTPSPSPTTSCCATRVGGRSGAWAQATAREAQQYGWPAAGCVVHFATCVAAAVQTMPPSFTLFAAALPRTLADLLRQWFELSR